MIKSSWHGHQLLMRCAGIGNEFTGEQRNDRTVAAYAGLLYFVIGDTRISQASIRASNKIYFFRTAPPRPSEKKVRTQIRPNITSWEQKNVISIFWIAIIWWKPNDDGHRTDVRRAKWKTFPFWRAIRSRWESHKNEIGEKRSINYEIYARRLKLIVNLDGWDRRSFSPSALQSDALSLCYSLKRYPNTVSTAFWWLLSSSLDQFAYTPVNAADCCWKSSMQIGHGVRIQL